MKVIAHWLLRKLDEALAGQPQTYEMRYFGREGDLRYARVDNSPLIVEGAQPESWGSRATSRGKR